MTIAASTLAIIGFILTLCIGSYSVRNVDIDLTVLKSFSFEDPSNIDISNSEPSLGKLGDDTFDCYVGICNYYKKKIASDCDGFGMCIDASYSVSDGSSKAPASCSENCRNNIIECNQCKNDNKEKYVFTCEHHESSNKKEGSCIQLNLVNLWKGLYFKHETNNDYNIFNAVLSGESCPEGYKKCGKLDEEYGNILCSKNSEKCPINLITHDENEINQYLHYTSVTFNDGSKLFYTNEATETGIIAKDIYFDLNSNNNNECKILDSISIGNLISDNNLPSNNNFNGVNNAYLIWCIPLMGKEKNLTKLREQQKEANENKTINDEIIYPVTSPNIAGYILAIIGFIFFGIMLHQIYIAFNKENNIYMQSKCVCNCSCCQMSPCCFLILFCVAIAIVVIGVILLLSNIDDLVELPNKLGFNHGICKTNIVFIFIYLFGFIAFIILFIIFIIFFCQKNDTKVVPYYN